MIDELAGILRLDPGPFTLRQLLTMVWALRHETWQHTATLAAVLININRKPHAKAITPDELNPYREKGREKPVTYISAKKLAEIVTQNR